MLRIYIILCNTALKFAFFYLPLCHETAGQSLNMNHKKLELLCTFAASIHCVVLLAVSNDVFVT